MAATNPQLHRVYLEYNPKTCKFYTAIDGDFAGIALAIAHTMSINKSFAQAVKLANHIRSMPATEA